MLINTEGIVLKQRKIANNRRLIVLFSKEYGKITAGTSINEKGRGKAALALRPFTHSEYDIFKARDSYNINSASVKQSFYSIGEDIDRFMAASAVIEYIDSVLEDGEPAPKLFDMTIEALECISNTNKGYTNILFAFIIKTLRILGVMPETGCCVNCAKAISKDFLFSVYAGGVMCPECAAREKSTGRALIYNPSFDIVEVLNYFARMPLQHFMKVSLKPEIEAELKAIISGYIRHYLGSDVLEKNTELNI